MKKHWDTVGRWSVTVLTILVLTIYQALCPGEQSVAATESLVAATGLYTDGTYEGSAEGYGGTITLSVTVANGLISEITILDASGEDKPYLRDAKAIIPQVIANQHTDLDAIAGATTTTWGILDATDRALIQSETTQKETVK